MIFWRCRCGIWSDRAVPTPIHNVVLKGRLATRRIAQHNPVGKAKENVARHYDLSGALYDLFLDVDRQYSCAYFESSNATLEDP